MGDCTIWAPTQNAQGVLAAVAHALGIPTSDVTVHVTLMGGGFGRRLNVDYGVEAALISRAAGAPVKVFWTREDDIRFDYYRPMSLHRMRAGLDEQGKLVAWLHHIVAPTTDGYYEGPETPDVAGSELAGPGVTGGTVPNYLLECSFLETAVPRGYLRAVDNLANRWAIDCFLMKLRWLLRRIRWLCGRNCLANGMNCRRRRIADDEAVDVRRLRRVIHFAAEKAGWGTPLAGERRGRGIAGSQAFSSYVSQVAEVTVAKNGAITVDRIVLAIDCGRVVNPDIAASQLEGGIIMGLTSALRGEITLVYKRLDLLTRDPEWTLELLDGEQPVQVVLAGKAHPRDEDAKRVLKRLFGMKAARIIGERVVFLDDYDLATAAWLVRGCDVWLNVPRPPLEASGTSGMKSAINGGLQLSVLDGWWAEGYDGDNGWAITGEVDDDPDEAQDDRDVAELHRLLDEKVLPMFYEHDARGLPAAWIARVRASLKTLGPRFSATRMLSEYLSGPYRGS